MDDGMVNKLKSALEKDPNIIFAFLFGSYAKGDASGNSDLDIAVFFDVQKDSFDLLGAKEHLRAQISKGVELPINKIDIVNLSNANLSISSTVAHDGIILKGEDTLALARFYKKVWGLEEEFYWRMQNEV